jgi:hypothetical protein
MLMDNGLALRRKVSSKYKKETLTFTVDLLNRKSVQCIRTILQYLLLHPRLTSHFMNKN